MRSIRRVLCPRGVEGIDKPDTLFAERIEPTGLSTVLKSEDYFDWMEDIVLSGVVDFELRDEFMFATKYAPIPVSSPLYPKVIGRGNSTRPPLGPWGRKHAESQQLGTGSAPVGTEPGEVPTGPHLSD